MTDPLSLAPLLPVDDRSTPRFGDPGLSHDERYDAFVEHVHGGHKVEARDWMPDEYRTSVLRFVEMHANSELMGVLPEREWIMRAPTLKRKLALTAMIILSALNGIATWYRPDGSLNAVAIADRHADLFLRALTLATRTRP